MSVGWISARWPPNTIFRDMPLAEFFQTTATINSGNSVDDIPADSESNVEKIRTRLADAPAGTPFQDERAPRRQGHRAPGRSPVARETVAASQT